MTATTISAPPLPYGIRRSTISKMRDDPFLEQHSEAPPQHQRRYSTFDTPLLSMNTSSSPSQIKRTLEAHLAETDRRLRDTSKLGTALVQQQRELSEKLREVERQQHDDEIPPELHATLIELEREHNDIGREIAKALIAPKSRKVSEEEKEASGGTSLLSSHATASPSKISAPSRKQRNQTSNRAGDIQLAADISTALLIQVRQLQAALAERDESLRSVNEENARREHEARGFSQRLRALDESEQRYKDENWNLETQAHELVASLKEAADREERLNASLAAALASKNRVQNELDDVKLAHGKLGEDYAAAQKAHDLEVHTLRRTFDIADNDRSSLQIKIDEVTLHNEELVKAMTSRFRDRDLEGESAIKPQLVDSSEDLATPDHSPPASPTKGTPRHGGLESETLKSSLHHAHRMIQNLKSNIHREKTEKFELKRMLQDARDELEQRRAEGGTGSGNKRQKSKVDLFKKPPRPDMLGNSRKTRTDIEFDEQDWEDHMAKGGSSHEAPPRNLTVPQVSGFSHIHDLSDAYHTANEAESAFETAHERDTTESDDFQTGAESLAGDSTEEATETEETVDRHKTIQAPRPSVLATNRLSFISTASTSLGEEDDTIQTPIQKQPQKFRLKMGRNLAGRRARPHAELTPDSQRLASQDSPVAYTHESRPPPGQQSLFAELEGLHDAQNDGEYSTPARADFSSNNSTPGAASFTRQMIVVDSVSTPPRRFTMVDSGTMTEPWSDLDQEGRYATRALSKEGKHGAEYSFADHESVATALSDVPRSSPLGLPLPTSIRGSPYRMDSSTQYTPLKHQQESPHRSLPTHITPPKTVWDEEHDHDSIGHDSSVRQIPQEQSRVLDYSSIVSQHTIPLPVEQTEPVRLRSPPLLALSSITGLETAPVEPSLTEEAPPLPRTKSETPALQQRPASAQKASAEAGGLGILGAVGAALGLTRSKGSSEAIIAEDETNEGEKARLREVEDGNPPLKDISGNSAPRLPQPIEKVSNDETAKSFIKAPGSDQGSQTILTSDQIDRALQTNVKPLIIPISDRVSSQPTTSQPTSPVTSPRTTSRPNDRTIFADPNAARDLSSGTHSNSKRPGSTHSGSRDRTSVIGPSHPPLPPGHRTAIAKAAGRLPSLVSEPANSSNVGMMGPPIAPASAYRRPRTPGEQGLSSPTRGGPTSRTVHRRGTGSQISRRSSYSSFASELDERFNIHTEAVGNGDSFQTVAGTDPRMIQAITQTMIGEFLWKYTRKPGGRDMSSTRHRRYFWVHPYTRTLYWSNQDPQAASRSELKAKSVAILKVQVVADENPMPPGLHRKSLEVITPGRKVKFTAATGRRHETWFNALTYLTQRGQDDAGPMATNGMADGGLTAEDVDEFNPGYNRQSTAVNNSRVSLSSYNSRTTRGTSANRDSRMSLKQPTSQNLVSTVSKTSVRRQSPQRAQTEQKTTEDPKRTTHKGSISRFSNMFKPSAIMGSIAGQRAQPPTRDVREGASSGSIYNASLVDEGIDQSAEELRRALLKQEQQADQLENVRACCDGKPTRLIQQVRCLLTFCLGKHDVSSLARNGRHSHSMSHRHSSIDRLGQSFSRRH